GLRIERVYEAAHVADHHDLLAVRELAVASRGAQCAAAVIDPLYAGLVARDVEREDAVVVSHRQEHGVADDRGLSTHRADLREGHHPGDFEVVEIASLEACFLEGEFALVGVVEAEAGDERLLVELWRALVGRAAVGLDPASSILFAGG